MQNDIIQDKIRFIKRVFGGCELGRDNLNVAVACPSKQCRTSHKKKLAIRLDNDQVNCWVCHLHGRLVTILKQFKSPEAVREYIEKFARANISVLVDDSEKKEIQLPAGFKLIAAHMDSRDPDVKGAIKYVKKRGLTERDMWYFRLGISSERDQHRRVIMLSFDAEGELNYFSGRAIDNDAYRKYMNSDTEKKAIIFNEINIDWSKELTLVEGPFDLTKCDENATALLGSSLSEDSLLFGKILQNQTPIVLGLDKDMEMKEWHRMARLLDYYDIPVRIINLGVFNDIGEMTKKQFIEAKKHAVPWDRITAMKKKLETFNVM